MMSLHVRVSTAPIVPVLALALAACGDDSAGSSSFTSDTATETDTAGTVSTTVSGSDTDGTTAGPGSGSDSMTDGSSSGTPTTTGSTTDPTTDPGTTDPGTTDPGTTDPSTTDPTDPTTGAMCVDLDGDGYGTDCPQGPDCDDNDPHNHTDEGCANCQDADMDMYWVGCDLYDADKAGPDCNDNDPDVGEDDMAMEICDGLPNTCSGEIDFLPADEMCPPNMQNPPNVNPFDGWLCDPPGPGLDGCKIKNCLEQFFDIDQDYNNGCECEGTSRNFSLAECGDEMPGYLGSVSEGEELFGEDLPLGVIPELDNGKGNGAEDWYSVDFPEINADKPRPEAGSIQIDFTLNENLDYRFEVYRSCAAGAWLQGIGDECTMVMNGNALEWWFFDDGALNPNYKNDVNWPGKVYIRVFRVQNDMTCSEYRLRVRRVND